MKADLLVIPGCPHTALAETQLKQALAAAGHPQIPVRVQVIDPAPGSTPRFPGSPTFLIDGQDLFDAAPAADVTCRLYPSDDGLAGLPDLHSLTSAVTAVTAAATDATPGEDQ